MRPSRRLLGALGLLLALGLGASIWPEALSIWWVALASLVLTAVADAFGARRHASLEMVRQFSDPLPLHAWREVTLALRNTGTRTLSLEVFDHPPPCFEIEHLPQRLRLPSGTRAEIRYRVRPSQRGAKQFEPAWLRVDSPLQLWQHSRRAGVASPVRIYPDLAPIANYIRLAAVQRLDQIGVHRQPRRGEGTEFLQLREYIPGDALGKIDWKATSRLHKLTAREYQDERDQHIVFLLDCGMRMRAHDDFASHFDQTLVAMLMLAQVALRQGDAVGFASFGGPPRWLAPCKGRGRFQQLLRAVHDLQPTLEPPDYTQAVTELLRRHPRRAWVIVIGNPRDEDGDDLLPALALLQRRHLTVLACVRESVIDTTLGQPVNDFQDALRLTATLEFQRQRERLIQTLRARHVLTLDVTPGQLSIALVNRYLGLKTGQLR
ncbi:MAG: DUF58 domain-containing protein [Thiotrichales bacterium]